jgi:hypothetical protein
MGWLCNVQLQHLRDASTARTLGKRGYCPRIRRINCPQANVSIAT